MHPHLSAPIWLFILALNNLCITTGGCMNGYYLDEKWGVKGDKKMVLGPLMETTVELYVNKE